METTRKLTATRIRQLRESRNLTQEQAAELCDIPMRTYQHVEGGRSKPRGRTLYKIAKGFGLEVDTEGREPPGTADLLARAVSALAAIDDPKMREGLVLGLEDAVNAFRRHRTRKLDSDSG